RICKNAGTGIPVGQQFTFTVTVGNDAPFDVNVSAGGLCQTVNNIVDGTNVHVDDQPSHSYTPVSCACNLRCKTIDLTGGSVDITVSRGLQKSATFTPYTTLFRSRLCKNAGTGIPVGQQFTFTVTVGNDAPFDVNVSAGGLCQTVNNIVDGTNFHV